MKRRLSFHKIMGVSFHHTSSRAPLPRKERSDEDVEGDSYIKSLTDLRAAALEDRPSPLSQQDIQELLVEMGRNMTHAKISLAIERTQFWQGVLSKLQYRDSSGQGYGRKRLLRSHKHVSERWGAHYPDFYGATLSEVRKSLRLWRHQVKIIEWITGAQWSFQTQLKLQKRCQSFPRRS